MDGAQIGNFTELFFDASAGTHLRFVDAVIALAQANAPVFGYMGIRFMPQSAALIGMPRFDLCASVEVSTSSEKTVHAGRAGGSILTLWQQGKPFPVNVRRRRALGAGGTAPVAERHRIALRAQLGNVAPALGRVAGGSSTFSTEFSRVHGLDRDHMFVPDDGRQMRGMSSSRNANMRSA